MTTIAKLKWLLDKENGMGISQTVLAKYCMCHPSTLGKYAAEIYTPTDKMLFMIEQGIRKFYQELSMKLGEE